MSFFFKAARAQERAAWDKVAALEADMRVWREESEQRLATELAQARQQLINALTAAKSARYQKEDQKKKPGITKTY
jgi:hypothetical protein